MACTCVRCSKPLPDGGTHYAPPVLRDGQVYVPYHEWHGNKQRRAGTWRAPWVNAWPAAGVYCPACWGATIPALAAACKAARALAVKTEREEERALRERARAKAKAARASAKAAREAAKAARPAQIAARKAAAAARKAAKAEVAAFARSLKIRDREAAKATKALAKAKAREDARVARLGRKLRNPALAEGLRTPSLTPPPAVPVAPTQDPAARLLAQLFGGGK